AEEMLSHIMKGACDETQKSERAIGVFDGDNLNAFVFFGPNLSPTPLHELARRIRFKDLSSLNRLSQIARAENTGEIRYLYVAEEAQGRGLGTSLFSTAAQELRETGYEHMRLITESDNDQARRFYEKLGGQTTAMPVTRDAYGTSMIAYRWSLRSSSNLGARP
ncbi:MAG: GNAT family N-acetyltransferase, partial [Pseudomonadota bacterium]